MKKLAIISLLFAFAAAGTLCAAEKGKAVSTADYPFWTSPKRGLGGQYVPGLNAVLQLSEAQREQIAAARDEMMNDQAVKGARSIAKSDPNVTAEQREAARATVEAATKRLTEKVATILTPEQKELISKIDAAYAVALEEVGIVYAGKFASVKADQAARQRIQAEKNLDTEEQFLAKLDAILTPAQKEAMERAAKDEEQRAANAPANKKVVK